MSAPCPNPEDPFAHLWDPAIRVLDDNQIEQTIEEEEQCPTSTKESK